MTQLMWARGRSTCLRGGWVRMTSAGGLTPAAEVAEDGYTASCSRGSNEASIARKARWGREAQGSPDVEGLAARALSARRYSGAQARQAEAPAATEAGLTYICCAWTPLACLGQAHARKVERTFRRRHDRRDGVTPRLGSSAQHSITAPTGARVAAWLKMYEAIHIRNAIWVNRAWVVGYVNH